MRRHPLIVAAAVAVAVALLPAAAGAASAPTVDGPTVVASAPDFATEVFADPWDFANADDLQLDVGPVLPAAGRAWFEDGRLQFDAREGGSVGLVWDGYSGALPSGRQGLLHPLDAGRYTHVAVRVRAPANHMLDLFWRTCTDRGNPDCAERQAFWTGAAGWGTYVVPLADLTAGRPNAWQGAIRGLRLGFAATDQRIEVDWVRVFRPTVGDVVVHAEPGSTVRWDADADPSNDVASQPGWGILGKADRQGRISFPADAYPPGTYRFSADGGPYSAPFTIEAPPLTVIDDPDEQGGEDYVTLTSGDPWDFSNPQDATAVDNVTAVEWSGGQLHATNAPQSTGSGTIGNPIVQLRMGGVPLDPTRYHRLTVRTSYDGPFSLSFSCGGGMHGRLRWWHGAEAQHVSSELVLYSDRSTYTWDLSAWSGAWLNDDGYPRDHAWVAGPVTRVWWDPNEDPCPRRWHLDDLALRADDEARGLFGIRWHDAADDGHTTVSLYRDTDARGFDGVPIATDLQQRPGDNVHWWSTYGVPAGTWWLYAVADDGTNQVRRYATGPVHTDGRPRVAGPDRVTTAVALSRLSFPDGAPAAVVAAAHDFPDALAGSALAAASGGPLLLNPRDDLAPAVADELDRLGVATVFLLGGPAAQSAAVEAALDGLGYDTIRLGGDDRYATAAAIGEEAVRRWRAAGDDEAGREVLLAVGTSFADALGAGALAGHAHRPLLLTPATSLADATRAALDALGAQRVTLIGGTVALSDDVARRIERTGRSTDRVAGADRFATAAEVAQAATAAGADPQRVVLASGLAFPDGLAAAPAAVADGGVLLLTHPFVLSDPTAAALRAGRPVTLKVAGGPVAIADAVVDAAVAAGR